MEWLLGTPQIQGSFASLGSLHDDVYTINSDCLEKLEEIQRKLLSEDHTLRTYRRAIGFGRHIQNDLMPLLIHTKDSKILDAIILILVNLTSPVQCLLSVEVMAKTDVGRHTLHELNKLLDTSKESFADPKSTKSILDYMKSITPNNEDDKLSINQCGSINNCLLLLRNILHINNGNCPNAPNYQNQILWNLFTHSVDKLLIQLMSCPQKEFWGVSMVQLISIMYKDQHVITLQKLLDQWFEASLSESSEDNESNTSPPQQGRGDSSPMLTSDPTSDSSDNGGSGKLNSYVTNANDDQMNMHHQQCNSYVHPETKKNDTIDPKSKASTSKNSMTYTDNNSFPANKEESTKSLDIKEEIVEIIIGNEEATSQPSSAPTNKQVKRECPSSQSELSDCGYGTQMENQEFISTSSNEDECTQKKVYHKPPVGQKQRYVKTRMVTIEDKKELRRKKLVKRSKTTMIHMKGLMHHSPTDEDISNILKEFTVDFLLKGYGTLVQILHRQLLTNNELQIDTSHFFWLITYFLKFASQLELDFVHIGPILSFEIISYLIYEGVSLCEQLELNINQRGADLRPYLRRMHLAVTAIREFLEAINIYTKLNHLSDADQETLKQLQIKIASSEDLRCMFILLLRQYNPSIQSKQYLQDLITTNHVLLLLLDSVYKNPDNSVTINMVDHIKQFATLEVMNHFGLLLADFNSNGEFVNDCIFTMMHHVGGDIQQEATLIQPVILKTFSQIYETEYDMCDDWSDLIHYIIHKFINTSHKIPTTPRASTASLPAPVLAQLYNCSWTMEQQNTLYWYYVQSAKDRDTIGSILSLFRSNGLYTPNVTRISIIQQLLQHDIISHLRYDELMKAENIETEDGDTKYSSVSAESGIEIKEGDKTQDDIQVLCDLLIKENKNNALLWLQKILVESCFVKLQLKKRVPVEKVMEPVAHHYILLKQSIPLIPWNAEQSAILQYQPFVLLLHKLGFHLPADAGKLFVRVPDFWSAEMMFKVANRLGPIDSSILKFDPCEVSSDSTINNSSEQTLEKTVDQTFAITRPHSVQNLIRYTPPPGEISGFNLVAGVLNDMDCIDTIMASNSKKTPDDLKEERFWQETSLNSIGVCHWLNSSSNSTIAPAKPKNVIPLDQCSWMDLVAKSKMLDESQKLCNESMDQGTNEDVLKCSSVNSDLTRMCVSDTEDDAN